MPIRYVGRKSFQNGQSLYKICRQLANAGEGRVVYRQRYADEWPTEKSFYRLTKVIPDKTTVDCRKGQAWGEEVYRGVNLGEQVIDTGHKDDWRLVPKHLEEEFCQITDVMPEPKELPSHIPAPPWMNLLLKQQQQQEQQSKNNNNVDHGDSRSHGSSEPLMIPHGRLIGQVPQRKKNI